MFFIFGIGKSTLPKKHLLKGCQCPHCQQQDTLFTETKANYFHLFFVPVFPLHKSTMAICTHCKAVYDKSQFSEKMNVFYQRQNELNPNKRPIWHGCGCIIIILLALIITGIVVFKSPSKTVDDPRKEMLHTDLAKTTKNPTMETDSTAFKIKSCLNEMLVEEMHPEEIQAFTKQEGYKLLVLLKVDNMKKIKPSVRRELIDVIKECLSLYEDYDAQQLYIGVEGRWNMVLTSAPGNSDLNGKFASEDILYGFYNTNEDVSKDTLVINKKK